MKNNKREVVKCYDMWQCNSCIFNNENIYTCTSVSYKALLKDDNLALTKTTLEKNVFDVLTLLD